MTSTSLELDLANMVGFRFHPSEEEIVNHYLKLKMLGFDHEVNKIAEVNVCNFEPWELPEYSEIKSEDPVWYFFSPRSYKYSNSQRAKRTTKAGYWKVTGKDRKISTEGTEEEIAIRKTLVFYEGRVPNGVRTRWIMHEYHPSFNFPTQDFVFCKLKNEAGLDMPTVEYEPGSVVGLDQGQNLNESNDIPTFGEGESGPSMAFEPTNFLPKEDCQLEAYLKSFYGCDETDYSLRSALDY